MRVRVGVTVLSFDAVMREVTRGGALELSAFDYSRFARRAVERGFDHLELTLDMRYVLPGSFDRDSVKALKAIGEEHNVTFSAHLPLWSVEPASHICGIRQASVNALVEPVRDLEELRPDPYVLHATGSLAAEFHRLQIEPSYKRLITGIFLENARDSVGQLVEQMADIGIASRRIALESVEFPFLETLRLAEEFETSVCIDTGHILAGYPGDVDLGKALRASRGRVAEIHLHDAYRRVSGDCVKVRDHLPLGTGDLDVEGLLNLLDEIGFDGPIVFELSLEDASRSLKLLQGREKQQNL
jgi:sugar phosphate isomerase/epimerase